MTPFAYVLLGILPIGLTDTVQRDKVDYVQVDHCYRYTTGSAPVKCFTQVIFWHHYEDIGPFGPRISHRVAHYVMGHANPEILGNRVVWMDGEKRCEVEFGSVFMTISDVDDDPEVQDREHVPTSLRRGLFGKMNTSQRLNLGH